MARKRTIRRDIKFSGTGIHSGKMISLILRPSSSGRVVFRRTDLSGLHTAPDPRRVEAGNCTVIVADGWTVQTVEHLLAALYVFGVDSLEVELDGAEIPAMDGSALPFVQALLESGVESLPLEKTSVRVVKQFSFEEEAGRIDFLPDDDFRVTCLIDYPHPLIRKQELSLVIDRDSFIREVAPARTFGFLKDVAGLRERGLALGGALENAVVLDEKNIINPPLRFPDEFVRHKILDLIGDISLWGYPLLGHIRAERAGHRLHQKALLSFIGCPECWAFDDERSPSYLRGYPE